MKEKVKPKDMRRHHCLQKSGIFFCLLFCFYAKLFSQCSPLNGAAPAAVFFNTGGGVAGTADANWTIARDSISGNYIAAIVMKPLSAIYYNGTRWISFNDSGEHSGDHYFFYRTAFNLPCKNFCNKSFDDDNTFCLSLDLYADNSIYEIYVNGVAQSSSLGNIPLANPFNPAGHTQSDKTAVTLCKNWKAGNNTLIVQLASSATVAGMLVEASANPPPPADADTVYANICQGQRYLFGNSSFGSTGYYFHTFSGPAGCDSNVVLALTVKPVDTTVINKSICEGQAFMGHTLSGIYTDTLQASNGCDSIRIVNLTVDQVLPALQTQNAVLCSGDSLVITPDSYNTYKWQDGSVLNHLTVNKAGTYSVTVTNNCGSGIIQTSVTETTCKLYFPAAFTPNNDGKNDLFKLASPVSLQQYHLRVYNKWGQLVFETTAATNGWDGTFNGVRQPPGAFVYTCNFIRLNKPGFVKGTVMLLR